MTMLPITGLTDGGDIDICDVAFLALRGSADTTLYMREQNVLTATGAAPAAVAAEINASLACMIGPYTSPIYGSAVYVNAGAVARVRPNSAGTGSVWELYDAGEVEIPALSVAAARAAINAAPTCGGTGGGGAPGGAWVPTITPAAGTTAAMFDDSGSFMRTGSTTAADGDVVRLAVTLSVTIAAGATVSFVLSDLPETALLTSESPMLEVTRQSGDASAPFIFAQLSGADAITVSSPPGHPVTLETVVIIGMDFTYRVEL